MALHLILQDRLAADMALGGRRRSLLRPRQPQAPGPLIADEVPLARCLRGLANQRLRQLADDARYERQVLELLVRFKELLTGIQFHEDAADRPEVRALIPPGRQQHLGASVLPCVDDRRMMLVLVRSVAEVDELYLAAHRTQVWPGLLPRCRRCAPSSQPIRRPGEDGRLGRCHRLEEDVLWLQIRVRQPQGVVQESERLHALLRKALQVLHPKPAEVVVFEKVVQRHAQRLEH
mmetsp:Transcript_85633/g.247181  ORF Transcript_85633/g.247181 Transcript_85633/m.247181 type:complete len:234 (+) Transcript_85633:238-939(+)